MGKKSQINSQILIGVIVVIMSVTTILFGYSAVIKASQRADQVQQIQFRSSFQKSVTLLSNSYGSIDFKTFRLPSEYSELCITNVDSRSELPAAFYEKYPVAAEAVDTGKNTFLMGRKTAFFEIDKLNLLDDFSCIPIVNGVMKLKFEGKANSALVEAAERVVKSVEVPEGVVLDDVVIVAADYSAEIEIPAGTEVDYPPGADDVIRVNELDNHPHPGSLLVAGEVYNFEPHGAHFDPDIPVTMSYDPSQVADPYQLKIYYYDSGWVELPGPYDVNVQEHTITGRIDHFSVFSVLNTRRNVKESYKENKGGGKGGIETAGGRI